MKGKNTFHLFEQTPPKWTPKFGRFRKKFKKFFKNTLHYICTGRGQFVGCFAKKFKIAFTYSHRVKPFAHPNSELFTKSLKTTFTYSHWEKAFVRPNSEIFTKDSKSPLIMFALREAEFGIIFEKVLKNIFVTAKAPSLFQNYSLLFTSWRQNCRHFFQHPSLVWN